MLLRIFQTTRRTTFKNEITMPSLVGKNYYF